MATRHAHPVSGTGLERSLLIQLPVFPWWRCAIVLLWTLLRGLFATPGQGVYMLANFVRLTYN